MGYKNKIGVNHEYDCKIEKGILKYNLLYNQCWKYLLLSHPFSFGAFRKTVILRPITVSKLQIR